MIAKNLLNQYRECERKEKRLKEEILTEKRIIADLKRAPSRIRKVTDPRVIKLENRITLWEDSIPRSEKQRQAILDLISSVPGSEGEILYRRYVKCEKWEQISEDLFYSLTYTHTLHNQGLLFIQERIDQFLCSM